MGGVEPHLDCDLPGHAQRTKKCLMVGQPFLQLPVKFQLHTSSQKIFRHKSVRSIVVQLSSGGFYIGKPLKIRFMLKCHNSLFYYRENWYKPSSRRYLCSVWAKIRNSKILGTFLEVKGSLINGGGVVPHFRTPRQGGPKKRLWLFFRLKVEEGKKTHTCKRFFRNS